MQLSLGGLTAEGEDATNELDYLVLEAQERIRLPEPLVNVVYHDKLSDDFLLRCVDLIRTGIGQPAFHNVEVAIERHLFNHKTSLGEARTIGIAGCVQSVVAGCTDMAWESSLNGAKMVELVLNNGKDPRGGVQLGPQTGDIETFKTYDDFYQAIIEQLKYFVPMSRVASRVGWNITRDFPVPFGSAVVRDCIKKGKDLADGGAKYSFGDGVSMVGVIDLANSLASIKQLVFEENRITLSQLREALDADFEDYEEVQKWCLGTPKYGNDDESVDSIAKELYEISYVEHQKFPDHLDRPTEPSAYSVTRHWALGKLTGALPNGRKARLALCDASVSAQPGTDKNGPTALVKSAAKVIDTVKYSCNHLNMKFHPSALKGLDGARKFLSLIKTYCDLGGYHVQFNCVSGETLKDAQLHPENYRDLIVRVAGFSAYFIHLDREVQDEIIRRTELSFR
jgi:formate C-acetyltransferase